MPFLRDGRAFRFHPERASICSAFFIPFYYCLYILFCRQSINSIVQGTAAEVIKAAMLLVDESLRVGVSIKGGAAEPLPGRLLLQIHDELLLECPRDSTTLNRVVSAVHRIMTQEVPRRLGRIAREALGSMRTDALALAARGGAGAQTELQRVNRALALLYGGGASGAIAATSGLLLPAASSSAPPFDFSVPLEAECSVGSDWGSMEIMHPADT
jgi:hypothetical protein